MNHILYHANCADGFTAFWVTQKALALEGKSWRGIHGKYGTALDLKQFKQNDVLYIVDFSLPPEETAELTSKGVLVIWLDHHVSAYKAYQEAHLLDAPFTEDWSRNEINDLPERIHLYAYAEDKSGATICWDYFSALFELHGIDRPLLLDHIEDRDLWKFQLAGTKELAQEIFSHAYDLGTWDKLMSASAAEVLQMRSSGAGILRKHHKDIEELLVSGMHEIIVNDDLIYACNLPYTMASDAAHRMCEMDTTKPFAVCYQIQKDKVVFSFRSLPEGTDVSIIAKRFGGGGHKHAAGCVIPLHSFISEDGNLFSDDFTGA